MKKNWNSIHTNTYYLSYQIPILILTPNHDCRTNIVDHTFSYFEHHAWEHQHDWNSTNYNSLLHTQITYTECKNSILKKKHQIGPLYT